MTAEPEQRGGGDTAKRPTRRPLFTGIFTLDPRTHAVDPRRVVETMYDGKVRTNERSGVSQLVSDSRK